MTELAKGLIGIIDAGLILCAYYGGVDAIMFVDVVFVICEELTPEEGRRVSGMESCLAMESCGGGLEELITDIEEDSVGKGTPWMELSQNRESFR